MAPAPVPAVSAAEAAAIVTSYLHENNYERTLAAFSAECPHAAGVQLRTEQGAGVKQGAVKSLTSILGEYIALVGMRATLGGLANKLGALKGELDLAVAAGRPAATKSSTAAKAPEAALAVPGAPLARPGERAQAASTAGPSGSGAADHHRAAPGANGAADELQQQQMGNAHHTRPVVSAVERASLEEQQRRQRLALRGGGAGDGGEHIGVDGTVNAVGAGVATMPQQLQQQQQQQQPQPQQQQQQDEQLLTPSRTPGGNSRKRRKPRKRSNNSAQQSLNFGGAGAGAGVGGTSAGGPHAGGGVNIVGGPGGAVDQLLTQPVNEDTFKALLSNEGFAQRLAAHLTNAHGFSGPSPAAPAGCVPPSSSGAQDIASAFGDSPLGRQQAPRGVDDAVDVLGDPLALLTNEDLASLLEETVGYGATPFVAR